MEVYAHTLYTSTQEYRPGGEKQTTGHQETEKERSRTDGWVPCWNRSRISYKLTQCLQGTNKRQC